VQLQHREIQASHAPELNGKERRAPNDKTQPRARRTFAIAPTPFPRTTAQAREIHRPLTGDFLCRGWATGSPCSVFWASAEAGCRGGEQVTVSASSAFQENGHVIVGVLARLAPMRALARRSRDAGAAGVHDRCRRRHFAHRRSKFIGTVKRRWKRSGRMIPGGAGLSRYLDGGVTPRCSARS